VFKLRHDEGVKERSFYLCKIQSFYYKKYVQCREIKKSTDFLRNLPKSSELIYRNVTRWVWQHCSLSRRSTSTTAPPITPFTILLFTHSLLSFVIVICFVSHLHPAARQFCRSTYTITDITIK
jgi:hypothetical protein